MEDTKRTMAKIHKSTWKKLHLLKKMNRVPLGAFVEAALQEIIDGKHDELIDEIAANETKSVAVDEALMRKAREYVVNRAGKNNITTIVEAIIEDFDIRTEPTPKAPRNAYLIKKADNYNE